MDPNLLSKFSKASKNHAKDQNNRMRGALRRMEKHYQEAKTQENSEKIELSVVATVNEQEPLDLADQRSRSDRQIVICNGK